MNRLTVSDFTKLHQSSSLLSMVVLYDYSLAKAAERAGIEAILVGDSVGMVSLGLKSTTPVTLDEMIVFCRAVSNGAPETFIIGDMPFGSYEVSEQLAVETAVELVKRGNVQAVKLEGGARIASKIRAISNANIPLMGHLGVTPQTAVATSGYKPYGKTKSQILELKKDMVAIEDSGAYSILLEGIPGELAKVAKSWVSIPIYSIGSGPDLDGQLLLTHDLLGLFPDFKPKFARSFFQESILELQKLNSPDLSLFNLAAKSFELYKSAVKSREFPGVKEIYGLGEDSSNLIEFAKSL
jgi:3-methyl-2-oxobutanoate hydroxymethyltransferase